MRDGDGVSANAGSVTSTAGPVAGSLNDPLAADISRSPAVVGSSVGVAGPHASSSAFGQEQEERQAMRSSNETPRDEDMDRSVLVEYGFDDDKSTATTRVYITRH